MKELVLSAALLMFISSLPVASVSNRHAVHLKPQLTAQKAVFMGSFGNSLPPIGYVTFCRDHQAECRPSGLIVDREPLTPERWAELEQVNGFVNKTIKPVTDLELYGKVEYWNYPTQGKGDCEDYVLLKRRMLIERGWPESTLLITVVRDENGEGHAVLTVRTDAGDLVLDNKRQQIVRWTDTPYTYVKQQTEANPLVWASLMPPIGDSSQITASHSR